MKSISKQLTPDRSLQISKTESFNRSLAWTWGILGIRGTLTTAALPDAETAPTARLDCLTAFLIIVVMVQKEIEGMKAMN